MNGHPTMLLGAYALGALEAVEDGEVSAHLARCPDCAAEVADLRTLPPLLDALNDGDLAGLQAGDAPPDYLFDRLAAEAAARFPATAWWRRTRVLLAAAAAAVLIAAGLSGWALASGDTHAHTYTATAAGVRMDVRLTSARTGTGLHIDVSGLPTDEHCTLVAVAMDGSRHVAGQWTATYSGTATMIGSTDVTADQLTRLVLLGTNGKTLLSVNL